MQGPACSGSPAAPDTGVASALKTSLPCLSGSTAPGYFFPEDLKVGANWLAKKKKEKEKGGQVFLFRLQRRGCLRALLPWELLAQAGSLGCRKGKLGRGFRHLVPGWFPWGLSKCPGGCPPEG